MADKVLSKVHMYKLTADERARMLAQMIADFHVYPLIKAMLIADKEYCRKNDETPGGYDVDFVQECINNAVSGAFPTICKWFDIMAGYENWAEEMRKTVKYGTCDGDKKPVKKIECTYLSQIIFKD